jgi:AcrR family transcriptional regulator
MALGVISVRLTSVPRWQPDARARLVLAALDLFEERGYDQTTVAEIADRAGLTKRTFFRYSVDKREVLFWGTDDVGDLFTRAIRSAPRSASALHAVALGFDAFARMLEEQGEVALRRIRIVRASPELSERQLIKFSSMSNAASRALRCRGVDGAVADLTAETAMTVVRVATSHWLEKTSDKPLAELFAETLAQLRTVTNA